MVRLFGNKWVSNYGELDDGTWLIGLSGLAPEDITIGLKAVIQSGESWPPSLPEFRTMCLGITEREKQGWIEQVAFEGLDSFALNHLTQEHIDARLRQYKARGLEKCLQENLAKCVEKNQLRLTNNTINS